MHAIVDDLLALVVAGKPIVGATIQQVIDDLGREAPPDAVLSVDACDGVVACSAGVLAQVVHNLVTNAIKYR